MGSFDIHSAKTALPALTLILVSSASAMAAEAPSVRRSRDVAGASVRDRAEDERLTMSVRENGGVRAEIDLSPRRFRALDGTWVPVDRALLPDASGGFSNLANTLRSRFPARAREQVHVESGSAWLAWEPAGMSLLDETGASPLASPSDAIAELGDVVGEIHYADVYPGVTERHRVQPGRIDHDVILAEAPSGLSSSDGELLVSWRVESSSTLEDDGAGGLAIRGEDGAVALLVPPPFVVGGGPSVRWAFDEQAGLLSVAVPLDELLAPGVSFPLVIDPTVVDAAADDQDVSVHGADSDDFLTERAGFAIGDVSGDGVPDLVLGARGGDGPTDTRNEVGEVQVLFGPLPSGLRLDLATLSADLVVHGTDLTDGLGSAVAVGDLSGDGIGDLVMAASRGDGPANLRRDGGEIHVLFGPLSSGVVNLGASSASLVVHGALRSHQLGHALLVTDVSGDGHDDLVAGAPGANGSGGVLSGGAVYAVLGPLPGGTRDLASKPAEVRILGEDSLDAIGQALAAGDVTGDGQVDLAFSSITGDGPVDDRSNAGEVLVLFGPFAPGQRELASSPAHVRLHGADASDALGRSIAIGDLTGDGVGDLVAGSTNAGGAGNARPQSGEAHVVFGPFSTGLSLDLRTSAADVEVRGAKAGDLLGVVEVGDITGEGVGDLIVGAAGADGTDDLRADAGEVHAFHGPLVTGDVLDLATDDSDVVVHGRRAGDGLGGTLAAGDVSGDSRGDLLVGARSADGPAGNRPAAGEAHAIFSGNTPPTCDAGGHGGSSCRDLALDRASAEDANGDALAWSWSTDDPDVQLADASGVLPGGDGPRDVPAASAVLGPTAVPCGREAVVSLRVDDGRGGECVSTLVARFEDTEAPALVGVPVDVLATCDAVPAPASVTAVDGCDPTISVSPVESRVDGGCPGRYALVRTWSASDACGNLVSARQVVTVADDAGPSVQASSEVTRVPFRPRHDTTHVALASFHPSATDGCSGVAAWRVADCVSSEAADGRGDGSTGDDCAVDADGQGVTLRAERSGRGAGRTYTVLAVATDACGNDSVAAVVGTLQVPHDNRL